MKAIQILDAFMYWYYNKNRRNELKEVYTFEASKSYIDEKLDVLVKDPLLWYSELDETSKLNLIDRLTLHYPNLMKEQQDV